MDSEFSCLERVTIHPGGHIFVPHGMRGLGEGGGAKGHYSLHSTSPAEPVTQSEERELFCFLLHPMEFPEPRHLPASVSSMGFPFPVMGFMSVSWGGHSATQWFLLWHQIIPVLPKYGEGWVPSPLLMLVHLPCYLHVFKIYVVFLWVSWVTLAKWISFKWVLQNKVLDVLKHPNMR